MALNASGPISLGGTTAGQSIAVELGGSGTSQISLNDSSVRTLAGVASGAITMPTNFWGKSNRASVSYTFSANTANASLNITSISGYVAGATDVTITVNSGVYLYSTAVGTAGLTLTGGSGTDTITLVNNGYIMGMGGQGGGSNNNSGITAGGNAISLGFNTTINNTNSSAYIGGGGGGGSTTKKQAWSAYGGGGGGAGGGNGGTGSNGVIYGGASGGSIGSTGAGGATNAQGTGMACSGAGGRIFPSTQTNGVTVSLPYNTIVYAGGIGGSGGGSGGAGGRNPNKGTTTSVTGALGGGPNQAGGNGGGGQDATGWKTTGGGGWGASGGSASTDASFSGAAGGKAVALNGYTVTWTSSDTTRVYGAIA